MVTALGLKLGKVKDDGDLEWCDLEWADLFHYTQVNYNRLKAEGKLPRLVQRLNYLAGYEAVDPLSTGV